MSAARPYLAAGSRGGPARHSPAIDILYERSVRLLLSNVNRTDGSSRMLLTPPWNAKAAKAAKKILYFFASFAASGAPGNSGDSSRLKGVGHVNCSFTHVAA